LFRTSKRQIRPLGALENSLLTNWLRSIETAVTVRSCDFSLCFRPFLNYATPYTFESSLLW
jgi:hypothetical protein